MEMARPYELKRRAAQQEETRQRIVDATIGLHQTVGPKLTTISEIAQRAGVGRVTVYRHFPDEASLARACSGHYLATHPLPDLERWRAIADPRERLVIGIRESVTWFDTNHRMIGTVLADARDHPVMRPYHDHWAQAVDALAAPWAARGRGRAQLRASLALALAFDTYRTLVREQGLTIGEATALLGHLVEAVLPAQV